MLGAEINETNAALLLIATLLRKPEPSNELIQHLVNILQFNFESESIKFHSVAFECLLAVCFNKDVKTAKIAMCKELLRNRATFPSDSASSGQEISVADFCVRRQLGHVVSQSHIAAMSAFLTRSAADTAAGFERAGEFIHCVSSNQRELIIALFRHLTRTLCDLLSSGKCERSATCGYLTVWTKLCDKYPFEQIRFQLASALILLFAEIAKIGTSQNDKMVRIVVISLAHAFFNSAAIPADFVATKEETISETSSAEQLTSFVLGMNTIYTVPIQFEVQRLT